MDSIANEKDHFFEKILIKNPFECYLKQRY